jgi:hypothetical protein
MPNDNPPPGNEQYMRHFAEFQEILDQYEKKVHALIEMGRDPAANTEGLRKLFVEVDALGMKLKDARTAMAMELFRDDF